MTRAAELGRRRDAGRRSLHRLDFHYALHPRPSLTASYLRSERQHFAALGEHRRPVYRRQARHRVNGAPQRVLIGRIEQHLIGERGERRGHRVLDRTHNRFPPRLGAMRNHQQRSATAVRPHRDGELDQRSDRLPGGCRTVESEQRGHQGRTVGHVLRIVIEHFDAVAFKHRHIDELAWPFLSPMFDDQQPRRHHLQHEAERRQRPGRAPDKEIVALAPDSQMNSRPLHRRGETCERLRVERKGSLERERASGLRRRKKRERDFRRVAFLAPEARPERRLDNRLYYRRIGLSGQVTPAPCALGRRMIGKVQRDLRSHRASGGIGGSCHPWLVFLEAGGPVMRDLEILSRPGDNRFRFVGKIAPEPEDVGFRSRHDRPAGPGVRVHEAPQSFRPPAQQIVHRPVDRRVEIPIRPGRNQMRVGAQQRVESGDLELVAENVDRIGAIDIERARAEQLVPKLLDPDVI